MSDETTLRGMTSVSFFCYLLDNESVPKKIKDLARVSKMLILLTLEQEDVTEELQEFDQELRECYQISWDNLVDIVEKTCPRIWDTFLDRIPPEIQDGIALEGNP